MPADEQKGVLQLGLGLGLGKSLDINGGGPPLPPVGFVFDDPDGLTYRFIFDDPDGTTYWLVGERKTTYTPS